MSAPRRLPASTLPWPTAERRGVASPSDPAALIERRPAAQAERVANAEARWSRFQAANRQRYAPLAARRPSPSMHRLLARAKTAGRVLLLARSGLWDEDIAVSLGSMPGPAATLRDYVRAGPDRGPQPRALFDQSWYLDRAPALAGSRWPLLAHYLVVGDSHNLSPHPLFDGPAYRTRHGAEMSAQRLTTLEHFLFKGVAEAASPHALFDPRFYVGQSDEVAASGENPLVHYLRAGWREGLEPHPLFAGAWYLDENPHSRDAGIAPLLHYVTAGAAEGLSPHPLFDPAWYGEQRYGAFRGDPLTDFLKVGARAMRSPTPLFEPRHYLEQEGGSPAARANPLLHYLTTGAHVGFSPAPDFDEAGYFAAHPGAAASPLSALEHWTRHRTSRPEAAGKLSAAALFEDLRRSRGPDRQAYGAAAYEALRPVRVAEASRAPATVIAIRRTTAPDWLKVAAALPNFRGHLQPRLPTDGFTDPADPATLRRDVALAQRYGLGGFCHEVADAAAVATICNLNSPAFPFCLAWTGPASVQQAMAALAPALAAAQAIRIDGRAVLVLPPTAKPAAWRKAGDLFLAQRGGAQVAGFDAWLPDPVTDRVPEGLTAPLVNPDFRGLAHDGQAVVRERLARSLAADAFPLVVTTHDTTPRSQDAPAIWHGARPGVLQAWLEAASDQVRDRAPERRLVFLHAWNDWETGAALAPDLHYGHGWLEAIANAADADLLTPKEAR